MVCFFDSGLEDCWVQISLNQLGPQKFLSYIFAIIDPSDLVFQVKHTNWKVFYTVHNSHSDLSNQFQVLFVAWDESLLPKVLHDQLHQQELRLQSVGQPLYGYVMYTYFFSFWANAFLSLYEVEASISYLVSKNVFGTGFSNHILW